MTNGEELFLQLYLSFSLLGLTIGFYQTYYKKNAFGLAGIFNLIGAFVWGDAIVFGIFWALICTYLLNLGNFDLIYLFLSLFWLVRSIGETIYWLNQQFSPIKRDPPESKLIFKIFHNDSVWFVYQIFWQCMTVIFLFTTMLVSYQWFKNL